MGLLPSLARLVRLLELSCRCGAGRGGGGWRGCDSRDLEAALELARGRGLSSSGLREERLLPVEEPREDRDSPVTGLRRGSASFSLSMSRLRLLFVEACVN